MVQSFLFSESSGTPKESRIILETNYDETTDRFIHSIKIIIYSFICGQRKENYLNSNIVKGLAFRW
jgi:hypothetical protein